MLALNIVEQVLLKDIVCTFVGSILGACSKHFES